MIYKKRFYLILVLVFSGLLGYGIFSMAQVYPSIKVASSTFVQSDLPIFAENQIIVKFKPNTTQVEIDTLMQQHEARVERKSNFGGFVRLNLPENSDVLAKANIFSKNPFVEYAHPNYFVYTHLVPNDPLYCLQWHLDDSLEWDSVNAVCQASAGNPFGGTNGGGINIEQAWNITTGSSSIVVAVIDTGVAYEDFTDSNDADCYSRVGQLKACRPKVNIYFQAPDLANTNFLILPGSDFVNNDNHPNDDNSHGTHVTGSVAQSTNNNLGVAGVSFNTTIMPIKVLDANGSGLMDVIADAIIFATDNGANIINMSLGSSSNSQVMEDAVAYAFNNGVVVVASAGNSFNSGNPINYPAAYDAYVIAVGATRYDETRSPYSSTGAYVDVAAPGGDTSVDQNGDGYADGILQQTFGDNSDTSDFSYWFFQGTSMAAPHVAGLVALILSQDNNLSPTQVRDIIELTAEDKGTVGRDDEYGYGIIDAGAALLSMSSIISITITTDGTTPFGIVASGGEVNTTVSGTDDVQIINIITGPVNLDIKSTNFSDGSNTWTLAGASGADQVKWEFSKDGITWTTFSSESILFTFDTNVAQGDSRNLYLKLTTPTSSLSANEHGATVTFVATQP